MLVEFAITAPNQARCQLAVVLLKVLPLSYLRAMQLLSEKLPGMGMATANILAVCISVLVTWCEHRMLRQLATWETWVLGTSRHDMCTFCRLGGCCFASSHHTDPSGSGALTAAAQLPWEGCSCCVRNPAGMDGRPR